MNFDEFRWISTEFDFHRTPQKFKSMWLAGDWLGDLRNCPRRLVRPSAPAKPSKRYEKSQLLKALVEGACWRAVSAEESGFNLEKSEKEINYFMTFSIVNPQQSVQIFWNSESELREFGTVRLQVKKIQSFRKQFAGTRILEACLWAVIIIFRCLFSKLSFEALLKFQLNLKVLSGASVSVEGATSTCVCLPPQLRRTRKSEALVLSFQMAKNDFHRDCWRSLPIRVSDKLVNFASKSERFRHANHANCMCRVCAWTESFQLRFPNWILQLSFPIEFHNSLTEVSKLLNRFAFDANLS